MKQWWQRQESRFDWMAAWMGGGGAASFLAHDSGRSRSARSRSQSGAAGAGEPGR
jgi:hypothetical protein